MEIAKKLIYIVNKLTFLVLIVVLFTTIKTQAQQTNDFLNVQYITSNDGLSQSEVTSILQDKKGFLWIGTRGGLNRYDGSTIKVFQNEIGNTNSLVNNSVETLFEDSKGTIYIGTKSNGVSYYFPELDRFETIVSIVENDLSIADTRILTISESSNNEIWLGSWNNGLFILNQKNEVSKHLLKSSNISDIIKDKDGNMWVLSGRGVHKYSSEGEEIEHISSQVFTTISEDIKTDNFYFGSWAQGLFEYNSKTKVFRQFKNVSNESKTLSSNNVYTLFQDDKRNLWIGTWGGGASQFNLETEVFTNYNLGSELHKGGSELYNDVLTVYQDNLGILWFGTNGGGVCRVNRTTNQFGFVKNRSQSNLPNEPIWSITKDAFNNLWVGIKGNEHIYYSKDEENFSKIKIPYPLPKNLRSRKDGVKVIYQDRDSLLWLADNYTIYEIQDIKTGYKIIPRAIQNQTTGLNETLAKVAAIYQTSDSIFWIGMQQRGIRRSVGPGNPSNQVFQPLLRNERITSMLEDTSGKFWVGTYKGLQLFDPVLVKFTKYSKKLNELGSISSNIVICLFEDRTGRLWVGTPNGLNLVIPGINNTLTFKSYLVKDGLPNNYIHDILEDDHGNLWISTNKGISRFNVAENSFYNYDVNDGLQSNSFSDKAAFKDKHGTFFFGGNYGLNIFHPDSIKNSAIPPVILTSFKISGKEIRPGIKYNERDVLEKSIAYMNEITLIHNENNFSIDYTTLDYHSSSRYSYIFKMEGLNEDWQAITSQKNVSYSNLNPGTYEFKVRAIYSNRNSDAAMTSLKIHILPPYWKTWQAFVLYGFAFLGLLLLYRQIIRQRTELKNRLEIAKINRNKEKEIAEMKTRFFTDIAHEFRTPLSLISGPVETILKEELSEEQQKNYFATIQYHTKRLLNLINQLLDFRKSESGKMSLQVAQGNVAQFTREIFLSFNELADSKDVLFQIELENDQIPLTYDHIKMEIVLCNLLSNAFKYSATNIKITVSIKGIDTNNSDFSIDFPHGYCEITVMDNGKGMSEDVIDRIFDRFYQIANSESISLIGTGIGLALVKNIVLLHKGQVTVKSKVGEGSTFNIKLPLGASHFNQEQFISNFKKSEDPIHYQVERIIKSKSKSDQELIEGRKELPSLLIVEDNPEIRSYVKTVFEENYNILEAENGKIGFEKARKYIPAIIISDLIMPEMDGIELCTKLRSLEETQLIPIILLTARTTSIFEEKGYTSGADIYVTKPFNPVVLKAQVEGLISSRDKLKDYFSKKITLLPTPENDIISFDQEFLNKVMNHVEDNLTNEKLNREFLASKMAVSPSTLYRKIKSITDLDITIFIRSIRLKRAAQMIRNKEDNISGIAYQVGFSDPKYFRKCFVKQFGVNPSQFVKNLNS